MISQKYTFQNLLNESNFIINDEEIVLQKIVIPIIQRDYAQGRKNKNVNRIRSRFLEALHDAIVKNKTITLDFIYGDVSKEGILTPLDGQQRLTTLFLLHWYAAKKEKIDKKDYKFLSYFTYETRFSSRDFCVELINQEIDFNNNLLSETIKDQYWYPYEWKNDPTIQSMLVMIDAIHQKFNNVPNLWQSLIENDSITFYFLPLKEMGLTDDLYIKMNSRGKPLTIFEHFKANFEEVLKEVSENLYNEISRKFDIDWTDMLFPYRGDNNIIDDEFMRYFMYISHLISYKNDMELEKDPFKLSEKVYGKKNENAKQNIQFLINSFDIWNELDNIPEFFNEFFSGENYEPKKVAIYQDSLDLFKENLDNYGEMSGKIRKFPLNKMLLLYAIITYLQNKDKVPVDVFIRRLRIVRNLIWNSQDEIRDERMKNLLSECETIILHGNIPIANKGDLGFNVKQKEEERSKIEWLQQNPDESEKLFQLEDNPLLKGTIAILGLENDDNFNKFKILFDNCDKDTINRALLAIDDFSQLISWRYQIGARNRESVWYDLFHPSKQRKGFEKTKNTLNQLLSGLDKENINNESLLKIINNYLNDSNTKKDWRYYVCKYSSMRDGNFGMYYWENKMEAPYNVIMMNTEKSTGGWNWNIFLYTLSKSEDLKDKLSLGNYGYQGDKLIVNNTGTEIDCANDRFIVENNEEKKEYLIEQKEGVDTIDRIIFGKQIILDLLQN